MPHYIITEKRERNAHIRFRLSRFYVRMDDTDDKQGSVRIQGRVVRCARRQNRRRLQSSVSYLDSIVKLDEGERLGFACRANHHNNARSSPASERLRLRFVTCPK